VSNETFRLRKSSVLELTRWSKQMKDIVADQLHQTVSALTNIQKAHLALEHIFCLLVKQIYFANELAIVSIQ